jgi:membrane protease YdiL (CAAX protease family)
MRTWCRRFPAATFYAAVLLYSWACAAGVVGPRLARGESMRPVDAFILFPLFVVGVAVAGIVWTRLVDGAPGTRALAARLRRWRVGVQWYVAAACLPPVVILIVLGALRRVSATFAPGFFVWGVLFGVFPGVFEEIGWSGYLLPQLRRQFRPFASAALLGVLWACWHLPVVNFLGAAGPHGRAWPWFFLGFAGVLTAMRVLMTWIHERTASVLLMQLMHASSTGALVVLSPPHIAAAGEALWYIVYALALWLVVGLVAVVSRANRTEGGPRASVAGPVRARR